MTANDAALKIQHAWRICMSSRYGSMTKNLTSLLTCVICQDETTESTRCCNGHPVCLGCSIASNDLRCPVCREPKRSNHLSYDNTLHVLLSGIPLRLKCSTCNNTFPWKSHETHRAWCPKYMFMCPFTNCSHTSSVADLRSHLKQHQDDVVHVSNNTLFTIMCNENQGDIVCILEEAIVLISFTFQSMVFCDSNVILPQPACRVQMRAFYNTSNSAPLHATMQQIGVNTSSDPEHAFETFDCGLVPAILASRERILITGTVPLVTPRTRISQFSTELPRALSDETSSPHLRSKLLHFGLRDVPQPYTPADKCFLVDSKFCAVMKFVFKSVKGTRVASLFKS